MLIDARSLRSWGKENAGAAILIAVQWHSSA